MNREVVWSNFAETELDKIFIYFCENASLMVAKNLVHEIIAETDKLKPNPEIGQTDDLLAGRNKNFRYLIINNYKIIYYVDTEFHQIRIVDVFDVRQDPSKIIRRK